MALISELKDFLKSPPYASVVFEKELRLKNPRDVRNKLMGSLESAGAVFDRLVLEKISEEIFNDEGRSFFLIIDSSGRYILKRMPAFSSESVDYDNFPSIIPYLDCEFWFSKSYLCIVERKIAEIWMLDEKGLLFVDLLKEDIPKRVRYGGLLGFEENRIRRHVEHHERNYLKDIKEALEGMMQSNKVKLAVIGVRDSFKDEVLSVFTEDEKFIISDIGTDESREEKLEKALEALKIRAYEVARRRVESMHPRVLEIGDFIKKLCDGETFSEIFLSGTQVLNKIQGFYCPVDYCLDVREGVCRNCGNRMLITANILDAALFKGYLAGSKINFVEDEFQGVYIFE